MTGCESYQAQFLPYIYDLLEQPERQVLEGHVEQCLACRAALAHAHGQQRLLAAAAKAEFPAVRFQRPAEEEQQPAVLPLRPAKTERRPRLRWAVAASILVLAGLSVPCGLWSTRYLEEKRVAER